MKRKPQFVSVKDSSKKKCWSRSSVIVPALVNKTISVYNGRSFVDLFIKPEMVGYRLGEFVITRKNEGKKK